VKRTFTRLAALATVGLTVALTPAATAQANPPAGSAPRPQRIVIVNIAKVLRDYDKANFKGHEITKKRQAYVAQVTGLRDQMTAINNEFQRTQNPDLKKQLEEKALGLNRQIQDIDRVAQRELQQLSNDTIVQVYQEIKGVIYDIAKTNTLDMVLCYPAASKPEDENSPQVAQLMLQTPALIPFYHQNMDITGVVIQTLNARYPSPKPPPITTTGGTSPAPMGAPPMPGGGN
jgi:Skp family chaperone for outer membrane proteins